MDGIVIFLVLFIIILLMVQTSSYFKATPILLENPKWIKTRFEPKLLAQKNCDSPAINNNKVYNDLKLADSEESSMTCDKQDVKKEPIGNEGNIQCDFESPYTFKDVNQECIRRSSKLTKPDNLKNCN
jgi:hypothetical protein